MTARPRVGIEKLRAYPGSLALPMDALCAAREHDPADIRDVFMIDERSLNVPWEDPVTMAVNAASRGVMAAVRMSYVRTYFPEWEEPLAGAEEGEVEYELTAADWRAQAPMS